MKTFNNILREGLDTGLAKASEVRAIDYTNNSEIYDWYDAIETLEDRGIQIVY